MDIRQLAGLGGIFIAGIAALLVAAVVYFMESL